MKASHRQPNHLLKLLFLSLLSLAPVPVIWAGENADSALDPEFLEFFSMVYEREFDQAGEQLNKVAEKIQIQPEQQAAWDNFAQMTIETIRLKREHQIAMHDQLKGRLRSMSAIEMLKVHQENLTFQQNEADRVLNSLIPLYDVLLPDQKLAMDKLLKHLWAQDKMRKRG